MVSYDPNLIIQFADRLYARANRLIATYVIRGFLLGGLVPGLLFFIVSRVAGGAGLRMGEGLCVFLPLGAIGAAIGWSIATEKVFVLKLQAQQALCQLQIEMNTRKQGASSGTPGSSSPSA